MSVARAGQINSQFERRAGVLPRCGTFLLACVVSGLIVAAARSSETGWWLGWIGLIPLFFAIRSLSPVHAALCGAAWGSAVYAGSFGAAHSALPHGLIPALVLLLSPAVYCAAACWITRRKGFHAVPLALGWALVELSLHPIGLKNGLLAETQAGTVWLAVGHLSGSLVLAVLLALVNAALVDVVQALRSHLGGGSSLKSNEPVCQFARPAMREAASWTTRFLARVRPRPPPFRPSFALG